MNIFKNINYKSLFYGIIISILCILLGYRTNDLFYPFTAIGLLYVGYCANDIKQGIVVGMITAIPLTILSLFGYLGTFKGFFKTNIGILVLIIIILLVGAFVGFVGAWAKRNRAKALQEYEKKNKKGKNKKKK